MDESSGEIKSIRTAPAYRRRGVGAAVLSHIIDVARARGSDAPYLETGIFPDFEPARALYRHFGFEPSGPFGAYREDPNTVFMRLGID